MKTPDEIKKGIAHCGKAISCYGCPYWDGDDCDSRMNEDALVYIQQLEAERDALLKEMRVCILCAHNIPDACPLACEYCELDCPCKDCVSHNKWQRRGVQKEE